VPISDARQDIMLQLYYNYIIAIQRESRFDSLRFSFVLMPAVMMFLFYSTR